MFIYEGTIVALLDFAINHVVNEQKRPSLVIKGKLFWAGGDTPHSLSKLTNDLSYFWRAAASSILSVLTDLLLRQE